MQFGPELQWGPQAAWCDVGGTWSSCAQVRHIRALAKRNHDDALPKLQRRIAKLGSDIKETDLWMTLPVCLSATIQHETLQTLAFLDVLFLS